MLKAAEVIRWCRGKYRQGRRGFQMLQYMREFIDQVESDSRVRTRGDAFRALRSLGLDDLGEFLLSIPNPDFPKLSELLPSMPNDQVQRDWTGNSGRELLKQTTAFIRVVAYNYNRLTGQSLEESTILDYGCGYGRISRLMYAFTGEDRLFGVDPWDRAIAICNENGLRRNYFVSEYLPTRLPVGPVKFDLIYAFSVFTHLSERAATCTMNTLREYVTDRGVLVITIRPVEYWEHNTLTSIAQKSELKQRHLAVGFAFQPHDREPIDGDITYGDTSMSLEWLIRKFPRWKVNASDRSLEDPLQRYVFLTPKI